MKRILGNWKWMAAITMFGCISFLASCTGPAGPAGKDGKNGDAAAADCKNCHGKDDITLKFAQYDLSKHNTGTIYEEEAGRIDCAPCHTGDGFAEAAALHQDNAVTKASSKINCTACHDIHDSFTAADFKLRVTDPFKLRQFGSTDGQVDFKTGNLCAKCHQARNYAHNATADTMKPAGTGATYARFGPHYGVIANVMAMKGLEDLQGSQSTNVTNPHLGLAKGCVSCHMGKDSTNPAAGGHTFLMPEANLVAVVKGNPTGCACHTDAANQFKKAQLVTDVKKLLADVKAKLLALGMLDESQTKAADGSYNVLGMYASVKDKDGKQWVYPKGDKKLQAMMNYFFIAKDRSNGIHNPAYTKAVLQNALEALNQ